MEDLGKVLNCIGDFFCYISDRVVSFPGTLNDTKKNIVLQCKMEVEWYQKIDHYSPLNMWGNVNGIPVSLLIRLAQSSPFMNIFLLSINAYVPHFILHKTIWIFLPICAKR